MTADMLPPAVEHGLLREKDWYELKSYAERKDVRAYANFARDLCTNNVPLFNHLFLGHAVQPFMKPVWDALDAHRLVALRIFRSAGKSTLARGRITHDISYATIPDSGYEDKSTLYLRESAPIAADTVNAIRTTFETGGPRGLIGAAFGDVQSRAMRGGWNEDTIWIKNQYSGVTDNPTLRATGYGGSTTGKHPSFVMFDDIVTQALARSKTEREKMVHWYDQNMKGIIDETTRGLAPHTPYARGDLNDILIKRGLWKLVAIPALNRMPTSEDYVVDMDVDSYIKGVTLTEKGRTELVSAAPCPFGNGNCPGTPEHFLETGFHRSVEYFIREKLLDMDRAAFKTQIMVVLVDEEEARIRLEMLRFWSADPRRWGKPSRHNPAVSVVPFPEMSKVLASSQAWDHAIGKKDANDYTSICTAYRTVTNDYFLRFKRGKWSFNEVIKMVPSHFETETTAFRRPNMVVGESNGFQLAYSQWVNEHGGSVISMLPAPDDGLPGNADKDAKLVASGILNHMTLGKVYLQEEDDFAIDQHLSFRADQQHDHDDDVDSGRMAFSAIRARIKKSVRGY